MTINYTSPEKAGIKSQNILDFHTKIKKKKLSLHSAVLYKDGAILSEVYYAPFKAEDNHRMFSIAKSAVAIAVGLMEGEGLISTCDPIIKYFPEKRPVHPYIEQMTIGDMLMMRTCHAQTTYDKFDLGSDWVDSFFTKTPTHKPGSVFHYDTSAPFVLSALCERLTGKKTWDYVRDSLKGLNLSKTSHFISGGMGVSHGGSGLVSTTLDILKLGIFFLNEGNIDGEQIISKDYMRRAVSDLTPNCVASPLPSESCGYGYYVWRTEKNGYVLYGMGGQLVIVCPEEKMILVTTADTQGYSGGNQIIYDAFYECILDPYRQSLKDTAVSKNTNTKNNLNEQSSEKAAMVLREFEKKARLSSLSEEIPGCILPGSSEFESFIRKYDRASYSFYPAEADSKDKDIATCESSINTKATLSRLYLSLDESKGAKLTFEYADSSEYDLPFGYSKNIEGSLPLYGNRTFTSAALIAKDTLYIRARVCDEILGSIHMELYFEDDSLTLYMKKIEETSFKEFNAHLTGNRLS